jgi:hypothetical protein
MFSPSREEVYTMKSLGSDNVIGLMLQGVNGTAGRRLTPFAPTGVIRRR